MLANTENADSYFSFCLANRLSQAPGGSNRQAGPRSAFPEPPVMPGALIRLELLADAQIVDLRAIASVIRSDVGLAIRVLELGNRELGDASTNLLRIEDAVVHAGFAKLRALIARVSPLSSHPQGAAGLDACYQFWKRACLTASVAEKIACCESEVDPGQAYLAGLFCRLKDLPGLLAWKIPQVLEADTHETAYVIAHAWKLPGVLIDVVCGDEHEPRSAFSRSLLEIATAAEKLVQRMEASARGGPLLASDLWHLE